jgi:hypothetical protein
MSIWIGTETSDHLSSLTAKRPPKKDAYEKKTVKRKMARASRRRNR